MIQLGYTTVWLMKICWNVIALSRRGESKKTTSYIFILTHHYINAKEKNLKVALHDGKNAASQTYWIF